MQLWDVVVWVAILELVACVLLVWRVCVVLPYWKRGRGRDAARWNTLQAQTADANKHRSDGDIVSQLPPKTVNTLVVLGSGEIRCIVCFASVKLLCFCSHGLRPHGGSLM